MRKVILEQWISLDGYISDSQGKLDFFGKLVPEAYVPSNRATFLESIDCILFGRKTYEQFLSLWPQRPIENDPLAGKINNGRKIVFSNSLNKAQWGTWPDADIEDGNTVSKIRILKSLPGKNMVLWGSITLAQSLMKEGLIDEIHLHVCPTLMGGGRRLFENELNQTCLILSESKSYGSGIVFLNYHVEFDKVSS
jgi:dihydrofolate reductase